MRIVSYLFIVSSLYLVTTPNDYPLENSKWKGMLYVPDPIDVTLHFSKDTLYLYVNTQLIETSIYATKSDTLSIKKVEGGSGCGEEIGIYTYSISDNSLHILGVSDDCDDRFNAFSPLGYTREP